MDENGLSFKQAQELVEEVKMVLPVARDIAQELREARSAKAGCKCCYLFLLTTIFYGIIVALIYGGAIK